MAFTKERFKLKADELSGEIKELLKEHGNDKIGEVTLAQIYQGMRGITGLVTRDFFTGCAGGDSIPGIFDSGIATAAAEGPWRDGAVAGGAVPSDVAG